ncbi:MAG TPA: DUF3108 domain-containing protein [Geobacteraceae bacterium]
MALFAATSLLAHLLAVQTLGLFRPMDLGPAVRPIPVATVTLEEQVPPPPESAMKPRKAKGPVPLPIRPVAAMEKGGTPPAPALHDSEPASAAEEGAPPGQTAGAAALPTEKPKRSDTPQEERVEGSRKAYAGFGAGNLLPTDPAFYDRYKGPVRTATEFLKKDRERLTFRISLLKIPVGSAVLEASSREGELRIVARIISNAATSNLYPVDDLVETRMIKGNYLLTRVRQNEGTFRSDFGFTLMLREKKAFWADRLANRYDYQLLPDVDLTDALAGFYLLRNRQLEVGKQVRLHLFDGGEYFPAQVDVLRRERVRLANLRSAGTIVIRPELPASGLFHNDRDLLVWLTDDENRVPVKLECATPIGKVTAELISSEAVPPSPQR